MSKVTSKRQITIPKAIADRYRIREGDDLAFVPAGDVIRLVPRTAPDTPASREARLKLFDAATERQRARDRAGRRRPRGADRGWTREELYDRGRAG